jgi:hypothetical protein
MTSFQTERQIGPRLSSFLPTATFKLSSHPTILYAMQSQYKDSDTATMTSVSRSHKAGSTVSRNKSLVRCPFPFRRFSLRLSLLPFARRVC